MRPLVLLPTYARVRYLEEQLACLLAQDMPCTIMVVNDCPWQQLIWQGDAGRHTVEVHNVSPFPSLSRKRAFMLEQAGSSLALWADDDDLCLPWYVRMLVEAAFSGFSESVQRWSMDGDRWLLTNGPWPLARVAPARLWLLSYCPDDSSCGEDKALVFAHRKACAEASGCMGLVCTSGYVYRWGQGDVYHASGRGVNDLNGYRADAEQRSNAGLEPRGVINLEPQLRKPYWSAAPAEVQALYPQPLIDPDP